MENDKLPIESENIAETNKVKLSELFPSIVKDGEVDYNLLKSLLGDSNIDDDKEHYSFTWNGKSQAIFHAQQSTTSTLVPDIEHNEKEENQNSQNIYIEGDNLEVLKILRKSYFNKIKMIYIDPPYNTENDFIYPDNYSTPLNNYLKITGQISEDGNITSTNLDKAGRKHTIWLNMMYPRLMLAKDLLTDDGVIFISIDDNEVSNLKKICDEIFGEYRFVTILYIHMSTVQGQKVKAAKTGNIVKNGEMILVYSMSTKKNICNHYLLDPVKYDTHYNKYIKQIDNNKYVEISLTEHISQLSDIVIELFNLGLIDTPNSNLVTNDLSKYYMYSKKFRNYINQNSSNIIRTHDSIDIPKNIVELMEVNYIYKYNDGVRDYLIKKQPNNIQQCISLEDKIKVADDFYSTYGPTTIRGDWWQGFYIDMGNITREGNIAFKNGKKPIRLIKQLIYIITNSNDTILDFFSGSSTTAHAVMQLNAEDNGNRKYIMVQLPELIKEKEDAYKDGYRNICQIGRKRIELAGEKIKEDLAKKDADKAASLDIGYKCFKLANSNFKEYNMTQENIKDTLNSQDIIETFIQQAIPENIVYEIILALRLPLTCKIEQEKFENNTLYIVENGVLIICLDNNGKIKENIVNYIKDIKNRYKPEVMQIVLKDNGIEDQSAKINIKNALKDIGITHDYFYTV